MSLEDDFPSFLTMKREDNTDEVNHPLKVKLEEVDQMRSSGDYEEPFVCGINGCEEEFTSEDAYQAHYETHHMHVCSECNRVFYTFRFLTLHVLEYHDYFFKELSKQKPSFDCLIGSCKNKSWTTEERKRHLICDHKIPSSSPLLTAIEGKRENHSAIKDSVILI